MTTTNRKPSSTVVEPSNRRAWAVLAVVIACSVVVFLDKALLGLVAQPLKQDLNLSSTEFGSISGASYLLFGITCLVVGFLANRVSPRWVLLACGLMWALGQIPALFAVTGGMLYASRLAVGAAEGPAQPMSHVTAYSWFPNHRRGLPASLITSGASIAKIAFAPIVTLIIVSFGWRAGFVTVGLLALVWSAVWLVVGKMGPYSTASELTTTVEPAERVPWRRFLFSGTFIGALLAYFTQGALAAVIFTWLPSYFQHGLGFSATTAGSLFGLPSAMAIVALLTVGAVSDRMLRRGVRSRVARGLFGGACLIFAGLVLCLLPWIHSPVLAVITLMIGYGVSTTVQATSNPVVAEIVPPGQRAGALGVLTALGTSAGVLSPIFTGKLLDSAATPQEGYTLAFLVFGGLVAFGGLCFALLTNPERDIRRLGRKR
ncbi:MFS transporter [Amycolatopsis taiwanensis]|uniref:MFS transporter n=1 Tax=Amycolatopsis taiwanensis TaxID=342230 RepID=UPI00047F7C65|nr:MFS transporter [Amycolatopsis taiwanensis]